MNKVYCQLLTPFTSGPWLQKCAGLTSVPSPGCNPDTGADTKCPDMKLMCQIMFYNQLPTSDTIHKWTLAPELGRFNVGAITDMEPGQWGGQQVFGYRTDVSNHVQLPNSDTIHKWTLSPEVSRFHIGALTEVELDTGADTKCPDMELMCQIIFYNKLPTSDNIHKWTLAREVGRFHIGALTDVEPGHWGGLQVSGHGTEVSNHVL